MSAYLFQLSGISHTYNGRTVLHLDELNVEQGSILGVVGHNGSGKSTLLRILALLEEPRQGQVLFMGAKASIRDRNQRNNVTLLLQEPYLLKRTVRANVAYGLKVRGLSTSNGRVEEALDMVGLDPARFASRRWHELSGGEAQRVALASRLAIRPKALLLDEPTSSLDRESTRRIREASLKARQEWGATLVVVSHAQEWLDSVCDSMIRLHDGSLVSSEQ